jgi:hypothetical protein
LPQTLAHLREGDVLMIWKLDRLGRSLRHLIEVVTDLAQRGIGFQSLQEQLNTTTSTGKLVSHMFGALAEFERDLIREQTQGGLVAARAGPPRRAPPGALQAGGSHRTGGRNPLSGGEAECGPDRGEAQHREEHAVCLSTPSRRGDWLSAAGTAPTPGAAPQSSTVLEAPEERRDRACGGSRVR